MYRLDRERLEQFGRRYPDDHCRQIAGYVLDTPDIAEEDHICAAGILNALEAAEHARDLNVVEVNQAQFLAAAFADAERLWREYGTSEDCALPPAS
ncbi:MAG: hypothetical protein R2849_18935 [Thermomicrobiales bacterium]